jgi:hypothetical protein
MINTPNIRYNYATTVIVAQYKVAGEENTFLKTQQTDSCQQFIHFTTSALYRCTTRCFIEPYQRNKKLTENKQRLAELRELRVDWQIDQELRLLV